MATDLLENFHILLSENRFFSKFKISTPKISKAIPLPRLEDDPLDYHLHINWPLIF